MPCPPSPVFTPKKQKTADIPAAVHQLYSRRHPRGAVTVQALASQGSEIALCHALLFRHDLLKPTHRVSTVLRQRSVSLW